MIYTCPNCGGNLDVVLDYDQILQKYQPEDVTSRNDYSLWRYLPLLPVPDPGGEGTPVRFAGWTPVYSPPSLRQALGLKNFWLKDEGKNPTASFKDRASSILIARAKEIKTDTIVTASTGNAGAALACMTACAGLKSIIFAPKNAPQAKIAQLLVYGATVILVDGNYDDAFDLAVEASQEFNWYCRNTGYNPFTVEGKKTGAFEIWEQVARHLEDSDKDLNVFVSVGDGNIISGIHKGFKDLARLGWMTKKPKIWGVQSEKSAAITNAFNANTETILPVKATTLADSISVDMPRDGVRALRAATETGGAFLTVSDDAIIRGIGELGRYGIFVEPAGSTAFMGLKKAISQEMIHEDDPVVVISTGNGLKDIKAAMMAVNQAPVVEPSLNAVKQLLQL